MRFVLATPKYFIFGKFRFRETIFRHEAILFFFGHPRGKSFLFFATPKYFILEKIGFGSIFRHERSPLSPRRKSVLFVGTSSAVLGRSPTHPVVEALVGLVGVRAGRKFFEQIQIGNFGIQQNPIRTDTEPIRTRYGPDYARKKSIQNGRTPDHPNGRCLGWTYRRPATIIGYSEIK